MRSLAAGLAALLVVAVVAGVLLAVQRSETRHQANLARARALQAETSRLATLARTLPNDQRDLALLLGAEAYRIQQSNETAGGLQAAVVQTPPGLDRVIRYRSSTFGPHLDRAGRLLAVAGQDGTVGIHDLATGRVLQTLIWPRPREFATFRLLPPSERGGATIATLRRLLNEVAPPDRTTVVARLPLQPPLDGFTLAAAISGDDPAASLAFRNRTWYIAALALLYTGIGVGFGLTIRQMRRA